MVNKATKLALINAAIAGGLVFAGSFSSGLVTSQGIIGALSATIIIFLIKMREYYTKIGNKKGMKGELFEFI